MASKAVIQRGVVLPFQTVRTLQLLGVRFVASLGPHERSPQLSSFMKAKVSIAGLPRRLIPKARLVRKQHRDARQVMRKTLEPDEVVYEPEAKQISRGMFAQTEALFEGDTCPAPCEVLELDRRLPFRTPTEQVEVLGLPRAVVCHRELESTLNGWVHRLDELSEGELEVRFTVKHGPLHGQGAHDYVKFQPAGDRWHASSWHA